MCTVITVCPLKQISLSSPLPMKARLHSIVKTIHAWVNIGLGVAIDVFH